MRAASQPTARALASGRSAVDRLPRLARALLAAAILVALLLGARWGRASESLNLLAGLKPSQSEGVRRARVLTDDIRAASGSGWNTELTAVLSSSRSFVEFDLGKLTPIDAVYLEADNNDTYVLTGSADGRNFHELWVSGPLENSGMRARSTAGLGGSARYVRLSAHGGDGSYAVSELQLFSTTPEPFPPRLETRSAPPASVAVRNSLLTFGLALCGFLLFARADARWYTLFGLGLVPFAAAVPLFQAVAGAWPLDARELGLLRAVLAAVALFALVRERFGAYLQPVSGAALDATLALAAALSLASFYDLGQPQFWNAAEARPEFVHQADMRVYYPFAKYYAELGYDGVYQASVAAYAEDVPGASLQSLRRVEMRDLKTHRLEHVADRLAEVSAISQRFTPARWAEFKRDMGYFRRTMGERGYLASHADHGANATPTWVALARPWFAFAPASEQSLVLGGLLDPVLLGVMFLVVARSFGLRTMLLAMIVFGATDLYMFGTNWGGATLRHDWIAYLGLGVCALRKQRWVLGGALLGLSVMIRAFPAIALLGVASAFGFDFLETWRRERRFPSLSAKLRAHRAFASVSAGALGCILVSVALTSALFGFHRWLEWWQKVALLDSEICTNDVSLRALVAFGTEQAPNVALRARLPLYLVLLALGGAVVASTTKRVRPHQAALLALPLIVFVFNPANYYLHFIALLPLLGTSAVVASRAQRAESKNFTHLAVSGPLLALCVAEYWTVLEPDLDRHFGLETLFTFAALGFMYVNVARTLWPELALAGTLSPEGARLLGERADAGEGAPTNLDLCTQPRRVDVGVAELECRAEDDADRRGLSRPCSTCFREQGVSETVHEHGHHARTSE
jgi:hypothetical protein